MSLFYNRGTPGAAARCSGTAKARSFPGLDEGHRGRNGIADHHVAAYYRPREPSLERDRGSSMPVLLQQFHLDLGDDATPPLP
jgi:hypothetical protein